VSHSDQDLSNGGMMPFYVHCLFRPSDNVWRLRCADVPMCAALFYCYVTFLDHRTKICRKVRAPRRVSALGAPNKFQKGHLDKTNMDKTSQHPFLDISNLVSLSL